MSEEEKTEPNVNPFSPHTQRCNKGIHLYDRRIHKQCPDCKKEAKTSTTHSVNLTPSALYTKLWRSLCRDVARLNSETAERRLNARDARLMLEYLKFLQEAKALEELETIEKEKKDAKHTSNSK